MGAIPSPNLTPEQFLAFERAGKSKNEYQQGVMYAMSGASMRHVRLTRNLLTLLDQALDNHPCEPFGNDLRLWIEKSRVFTYPDILVICGKPATIDHELDTVTNPTLLVEVLSPSTEAYDRGKKFAHYQTILSLKEYVLVSQDEPRIERYLRKSDETWSLAVTSDLGKEVTFQSIGVTLPLAAVYKSVF